MWFSSTGMIFKSLKNELGEFAYAVWTKKARLQNQCCTHFPFQFCKSVIKTIFTHDEMACTPRAWEKHGQLKMRLGLLTVPDD